MPKNRITQNQPDYVFLIVKRPIGWKPKNYFDMPTNAEVVSKMLVASYPEAHDDLKRCNRLSLAKNLDYWAMVHSVEAQL